MSMSFSFGDGLSVAAVTLIGQSLGRKRPDMAKIYGNVCQKLGLICAAVVSTVYVLFGRQIYRLYSDETVILDYGVIIMNILSVLLFFQILQVVQFGACGGRGIPGLPPWCPSSASPSSGRACPGCCATPWNSASSAPGWAPSATRRCALS